MIFSSTVELVEIGGSRWFIIFDFQQHLFLTNFDQTYLLLIREFFCLSLSLSQLTYCEFGTFFSLFCSVERKKVPIKQ